MLCIYYKMIFTYVDCRQKVHFAYCIPIVNVILLPLTVADPGFPRGGASPCEAPTYEFAKFPPKMHEIERIWTRRGRPKFYYVDQPLVDLLGDSGVNRDPLKEKRYKTDYF